MRGTRSEHAQIASCGYVDGECRSGDWGFEYSATTGRMNYLSSQVWRLVSVINPANTHQHRHPHKCRHIQLNIKIYYLIWTFSQIFRA